MEWWFVNGQTPEAIEFLRVSAESLVLPLFAENSFWQLFQPWQEAFSARAWYQSKGSFHSVVHTKRSRTLFCIIGLQPQWVQLLGQFQPPCSLWPSCLATWGSQCFLAVLTHQAIKSADRKEKVIHPGTDRSRMRNSSKLLVFFAPQADCAVKIGKVSSSEKISAGRDPRDSKGL